jgi:hypothetical protein
MKATKNIFIGLAGLIAGGASFFAQYLAGAKMSGFNVLYFTFFITFLFAFLLGAFLSVEVPTIAMIFTGSVLLAVIVKFFYDIQFVDPASHNLLPFEIGMYLLVTSPSAFVGAFLGKMVKRGKKRRIRRHR